MKMPPYPWQKSVWQSFVGLVNNDTLPHALLISAVEGLGAEKLLAAMAEYLLCQSPMEGLACSSCRACQLLTAGNHPDKFDLVPEEAGKAIKVDQVRQVIDFVAKTSQQGGRKVVFVSPAEAMNINAANSLLKCLEEPAGDTVLLLLSHAAGQLMPTIRSRCTKLSLAAPSAKDSVEWLTEQGIDNSERLLQEAGMAPVKVLEWWNSEHFKQREQMFQQWRELTEGRASLTALAASWGKQDLTEVLDALLAWLDALIRDKSGIAQRFGLEAEAESAYIGLTQAIPLTHIYRYRDVVLRRKAQVLSRLNLNASLALEELLLDWRAILMAVQKKRAMSGF
ncbi:DNA polymerase-3 subunit delta' [Alteromonadaceae bacterium Bs31]|nr:DNA polymerase-3 subunit delta' [Alteromonadaceae bacterium Bs31]